MKRYRCLVLVGIILLSIVCFASCDGETHTYARDAWFSENVLNDCALPTMPTPAEGISYVKEDENSIYLNLSRKEYVAYIESLYNAVLAEDFAFMGAVKDVETNTFGKTTYRTRMANLFYEFFIGESGENEEYCILFGNEEPQAGRVNCTRVHVWWSESTVAPIGDDNFPYNTKITICRTADRPKERYTIAQYKIAYEAAPDGTSTLTGTNIAYEGQIVKVTGTYEGESWHYNLYLNQKKLGCSSQSISQGGYRNIQLSTKFAMPGEDITISWTGGNEDFVGSSTTFDRVATWINGLDANDVACIGDGNDFLPSGQQIPIGSVVKVEDPAVIARVLDAWKKSVVTRTYGGDGMADGGYVFSLSFIMKDGSAESIHAYSGTTYVPKGYEGRGVSFHIDKFHSYTQEEMRRYYCFSEYGLFGYSMDDAITLEKVIDGSRIEIGSYLPTEELLALLESTKMQMLDIHEAEGEVLYSIENKTGFDIHIFSDTMIGFLIYPKDNFYYLYEITEGASMDEIIALLLSLAEQP